MANQVHPKLQYMGKGNVGKDVSYILEKIDEAERNKAILMSGITVVIGLLALVVLVLT